MSDISHTWGTGDGQMPRSLPALTHPMADSMPGHHVDASAAVQPDDVDDQPSLDYPTPPAIQATDVFTWATERPTVELYDAFGRRLAACGDIYRNTPYAGGLLLASVNPRVPPTPIQDAAALAPVILDRVRIRVLKDGKTRGGMIPAGDLKIMLRSEAFLRAFRPVDSVDRRSRYLDDITLTRPGYNDGGHGQRILHVGDVPRIESEHEAIDRFLDVMAFASDADRVNAVAAALTVMLRGIVERVDSEDHAEWDEEDLDLG